MPKWIGVINVIGPEAYVIEAASEQDARDRLYERWLEACENNADRTLLPYTQEMADELEADDI
jgi:hypothetical protein